MFFLISKYNTQFCLNVHVGCDSKLKEGLPEECNVACVLALSRFDDVCRTLQNGDMTVFNLRKIDNNEQQMKRLCEAVTKFAKGEQMTYDTLRSTLLRRLQEFTSFKHCKAMYLSICNWVPSPESVRGRSFSSKNLVEVIKCM